MTASEQRVTVKNEYNNRVYTLRWTNGYFELVDEQQQRILLSAWTGVYEKGEAFKLVCDALGRIFGVPKEERHEQ